MLCQALIYMRDKCSNKQLCWACLLVSVAWSVAVGIGWVSNRFREWLEVRFCLEQLRYENEAAVYQTVQDVSLLVCCCC